MSPGRICLGWPLSPLWPVGCEPLAVDDAGGHLSAGPQHLPVPSPKWGGRLFAQYGWAGVWRRRGARGAVCCPPCAIVQGTGACSSRSAPCHSQLMEEIWKANFVHPPAVFSPRLRLCWDFGQQHHHIPITNPIHARQRSGSTEMSEEPFPGVPGPRILQLLSPAVHQAWDSLIHLH